MGRLSGHGLAVDLPRGWDGAVTRRPGGLPVLHAGSMPLPAERGDAGGGVVERLGWGDVFVALLEHERLPAGAPLFAAGPPATLSPDRFVPGALQGMRPVQSGAQWFFTAAGRSFSLFVVVGEHARRQRLLPPAERVVASLAVEPA
ncbi:MAG TPA: hypothetical protein VFJ85_12115 [Acidimicrobiales bacterium]|nr:hypothetical protein [Acidimicrobiales bacterium]